MGPSTAHRPRTGPDARTSSKTIDLFTELLGPPSEWGLRVRLWDGSTHGPPEAAATILLEHPWSARSMFWPPNELSAGEAYIFGDADILGEAESVFAPFERIIGLERRHPVAFSRAARILLRLPAPPRDRDENRAARLRGHRHSLERDGEAVRYHYDVSNDFYSLWLDQSMQYSCAYFASPHCGIDAAQQAKVEHICRKLRLVPGDHVLDIGCGWGGLLEHAASRHGVTGLGVTLSEPQAEHAAARLRRAGVADAVRVEVRDYREVQGRFDKIVSVGMVEHVGSNKLAEYFGKAFGLLEPGGVFLNHGISTAWHNQPAIPRGGFAHRYVFPDGELVPISGILTAAEEAGFEVRDVENLREHYTQTLRHWVRRLEDRHAEVVAETDETTYRIWRLYMSAAAHGFDKGLCGVYQSLLHKPVRGPSGLPPTREDWYRAASRGAR